MSLGDCYEAAAKYILYEDPSATLVHGIPILGTDGKPFGHAWVEKGNKCIDVANGNHAVLPKILYYAMGHQKEKDNYKYTQKEIMKWITKTEHWGPWELDPPR